MKINLRVRIGHEPKMPLLTELKNLFCFALQRYRADGAADNKLNSAQPVFVNFDLSQPSLKAIVGIGLNYPPLRGKYARFHWLLNINQVNPA